MEKHSAPFTQADLALGELVSRAFLTASLLTADEQEAERATIDGINAWDCETESGDALFQRVLTAAARTSLDDPSNIAERRGDWTYLPIELRRVLTLPPVPRKCFVLFVLVGLPVRDCARMLNLQPSEVVEGSLAAYGFLNTQSAFRI